MSPRTQTQTFIETLFYNHIEADKAHFYCFALSHRHNKPDQIFKFVLKIQKIHALSWISISLNKTIVFSESSYLGGVEQCSVGWSGHRFYLYTYLVFYFLLLPFCWWKTSNLNLCGTLARKETLIVTLKKYQ